ncbi:MAG: hypothetical protein ABJH07_00685 [Sedimentitalea sp.]|uniref:hypothetical protein n=1 Tax=Sedimentitalea sp. TaxID=2048915 RepID=UPI00326503BC
MDEVEFLHYLADMALAPFREAGRDLRIFVDWHDDDHVRITACVDGELALDGLVFASIEDQTSRLCELLWRNRFGLLSRLRSCGANEQILAGFLGRVSYLGPELVPDL